jgi:hypothetical protein
MISEPPKPSQKNAIDLSALGHDQEFQMARSLAIEAYARLESSLSRLLAALLGTNYSKASIVYFSLLNTRSRNSMFESLIAATHGDKYDVHWNGRAGQPGVPRASGLLALIRLLDDERNQIVHWHTIQDLTGTSTNGEKLAKPEFWFRDPQGTPNFMGSAELWAFARKAEFVSRSVNMFTLLTSGQHLTEEAKQTWPQIFQQPVPYPPSDTHPLSPICKAPDSPPRSSRG